MVIAIWITEKRRKEITHRLEEQRQIYPQANGLRSKHCLRGESE